MASGVELSIQLKNATRVRQGLENLKKEIPDIGAQRIYNAMLKAQTALKKPGKRVRYPIWWESEKQRRAFFATNGFGKGIPYRRTGAYNAGFVIRKTPNASRASVGYSLVNRVPYAKYVGGSADGTAQSTIHLDRWALIRNAMDKAVGGLRADVREHIAMIARRRIG
jgi:hypothetical protein